MAILIRKNILIIGCIISCFILVSLSYQPIMAEKSIIETKEEIDVVVEDCGCNSNGENRAPIILCGLLNTTFNIIYNFAYEIWFLSLILKPISFFLVLIAVGIVHIMESLDCPYIPQPIMELIK